jgi:hypothetical protein
MIRSPRARAGRSCPRPAGSVETDIPGADCAKAEAEAEAKPVRRRADGPAFPEAPVPFAQQRAKARSSSRRSRSRWRRRRPSCGGSAKSPRGYVVLTIGLPGSGKTTWYKRRGVTRFRATCCEHPVRRHHRPALSGAGVFSTLRSLLRARLIAKMPWNYVDATNLSPHERRSGSRWRRASATRCRRCSSTCRWPSAWSATPSASAR